MKVSKLAEMAKLTNLIREKTVIIFIADWKPRMDFLLKKGKMINYGVWIRKAKKTMKSIMKRKTFCCNLRKRGQYIIVALAAKEIGICFLLIFSFPPIPSSMALDSCNIFLNPFNFRNHICSIVLHCIILHCIVLCCIVLCCIEINLDWGKSRVTQSSLHFEDTLVLPLQNKTFYTLNTILQYMVQYRKHNEVMLILYQKLESSCLPRLLVEIMQRSHQCTYFIILIFASFY